MPYRVETALSNRAGCQATECKAAGIKIDKDELRLGTWVEFDERGNWMWRHWGCVSGKILQNIREAIEDPANPGTYRWDYLDGYEGGEKNSLDRHPDLQEKVRRVITQGFIDPEDFNGDADMNKLGESGLRNAESKKRMRDEKKAQTNRIKELEAQLAQVATERDALRATGSSSSKMDVQLAIVQDALNEQKTPTKSPAKRKVKPESDGEEEAKPAAKKKRATKAKKEVDEDGEEVKPARKPRAKKAAKQEELDDYEGDDPVEPVAAKPARKSRAKKVVKAEQDEKDANDLAVPAPKKRAARGRKAVKQEEEEEAGEPSEAKPAPKRGRKPVKKEPSEDLTMPESSGVALDEGETANTTLPNEPESSAAVKGEPSEAVNLTDAPNVHDEPKLSTEPKAESSEAVDMASAAPTVNDDSQDTAMVNAETNDSQADGAAAEAETESQPKKKGGRGKKAAAPANTSTRASRSRTASKA